MEDGTTGADPGGAAEGAAKAAEGASDAANAGETLSESEVGAADALNDDVREGDEGETPGGDDRSPDPDENA